jgi:predicted transcriptional regulator
MRRMTVDLTDETLKRIEEIQKVYDVDIDVIVAVAIKSFYDTQRESTLLDVLDDDSCETLK